MSLKTRLRISIAGLVLLVVSGLLALNLHTVAEARFEELFERSNFIASQVESTLLRRLREQASAYPPTATLEETKATWRTIVERDEELAGSLRDTLAGSRTVLEIQIVGENGRVLSSSDPASVGQRAISYPLLSEWQKQSRWSQLAEVFGERKNYEITIPLGVAEQTEPVFQVKVIVSSVLLRNTLGAQVRQLGVAFLFSLLAALGLAILGSNIAFRPLARVSAAIDRIARGDTEPPAAPARTDPAEVAAIESKLQVLGQQFRGVREDATELRSNVEQLLERLGEAVLLFDRNERLIMAGRAVEGILGRGRWELMGRPIEELFAPSTPAGAAVRGAIEFRKSLRDSPITIEREEQPAARLLMDVEPLESFPSRDRLGTLITLRDAETRREIGTRLDISARLAAISRLTGGVAHEIKNPLNSITVHLEVLRTKLADAGAEAEQEIDVIAKEITRLDRVVKTFLDFTRPVELRPAEIDLAELVGEIASLVEPAGRMRGIKVTAESDPGRLTIRGDRDLLKQAVLNVVMNGLEAMGEGGNLRLEVRQADGECVIGVHDQGHGIPQDLQEKIFNLYFTTKAKGSGIGLALTFRAVQLHNGTIDFKTEEGKGTSFWIRLPLVSHNGREG